MTKRTTRKQKRERTDAGLLMIMLAGCALMFGAIIVGAYQVDQARGITVDASMRSVGL